jgi:hypothetical protein
VTQATTSVRTNFNESIPLPYRQIVERYHTLRGIEKSLMEALKKWKKRGGDVVGDD